MNKWYRLFITILHGIMGFVMGFIIGPFSLLGKFYVFYQEDELKKQHGLAAPIDFFEQEIDAYGTLAIMTVIALLTGCFYGAIRGAQLAMTTKFYYPFTTGFKENSESVWHKLFTYNTTLTLDEAKQIPETKLSSYRKYRQHGLLPPLEKQKERELKKMAIAAMFIAKGQHDPHSFFSRLPTELNAAIVRKVADPALVNVEEAENIALILK